MTPDPYTLKRSSDRHPHAVSKLQGRVRSIREHESATAFGRLPLHALKPALACRFERSSDEAAEYVYDEARQLSVWQDGTPVVGDPESGFATRADRDPGEPVTSTKAARDPGDVVDETLSKRTMVERVTCSQRGRDRPEPQTGTFAERDPGDVAAAQFALLVSSITDTERTADGRGAEPSAWSDDLVTGVVAY